MPGLHVDAQASSDGAYDDAYFPAPSDYDPHISVAQWRDILQDPELTTPDTLAMLIAILQKGGEATCVDLARHGGKSSSYYNALGMNFGRRISAKRHIPGYQYNDKTAYLVIPFRGATSTATTAASTMSGGYAMNCGRHLPIWETPRRLHISLRQGSRK